MNKLKYVHIQCPNCKDVVEVIDFNPLCKNCMTVLYVERDEKFSCAFCGQDSKDPICDDCLIKMRGKVIPKTEKVIPKKVVKPKQEDRNRKQLIYFFVGITSLFFNYYITGVLFLYYAMKRKGRG